MKKARQIPIPDYRELSVAEMRRRSAANLEEISRRRSVRHFSDRPVPYEIIRDCVAAAGSAPSGANRQPWSFVVVRDAAIKRRIRLAAEAEEHDFYHGRASNDWLEALSEFGTDEFKPFLETAPYLIAVFSHPYGLDADGGKRKHYYVAESVGIAVGFLIAALHRAGLACLTHTPVPMRFLAEILERPANERSYLLLPVGYPADGALVPDIERKPLSAILTFV